MERAIRFTEHLIYILNESNTIKELFSVVLQPKRGACMKEFDVIIVGAGLAGLSAAWELTKQKFEIAVLEAMDRVGGRVHSFQTKEDVTVDLGAQWIGPNHGRMHALAKEFGLSLVDTYKIGKTIYHLRGRLKRVKGELPPLSAVGLLDFFRMEKKIESIIRSLPAQEMWKSPLARKIDSYTLHSWIQSQMFSKTGQNFFNLFAEVMCVELSEPSALDFLWSIKTAGGFKQILTAEEQWFAKGAQTLPLKMADAMQDHIYLNTPVKKIEYNRSGALVFSEKHVWKAKKVIIAVPPSLSDRIEYDPPLPSGRDLMTQKIGQSSVIKIILLYEKPFWRDEGLSGSAHFDQGFVRFVADSSPQDGKRGVLTVLIGGRYARDLAKLETDQRKQVVLNEMGALFGTKAEQPYEYYEKDWTQEPWIRGGYAAHFPPGIITAFGEWLHQPIGPIHWASTETADEWKFYMEGAVQSGERAAKEVLQTLI